MDNEERLFLTVNKDLIHEFELKLILMGFTKSNRVFRTYPLVMGDPIYKIYITPKFRVRLRNVHNGSKVYSQFLSRESIDDVINLIVEGAS